jgi:hypothetical protein
MVRLSVTLRAQLKCNDENGPNGPCAYGGVVCVTVRFGFKGQRPNPPRSAKSPDDTSASSLSLSHENDEVQRAENPTPGSSWTGHPKSASACLIRPGLNGPKILRTTAPSVSSSSNVATKRTQERRTIRVDRHSSGERSQEDGGLDKAAGHRPRQLFGTTPSVRGISSPKRVKPRTWC